MGIRVAYFFAVSFFGGGALGFFRTYSSASFIAKSCRCWRFIKVETGVFVDVIVVCIPSFASFSSRSSIAFIRALRSFTSFFNESSSAGVSLVELGGMISALLRSWAGALRSLHGKSARQSLLRRRSRSRQRARSRPQGRSTTGT